MQFRVLATLLALCLLADSLCAAKAKKWKKQGGQLRGGNGNGQKDETCQACATNEYGGGIVLSERPRIIYYPNFLTDEAIEAILRKGEPLLKPSRTDAGVKHEVRSSVATFFTPEMEMETPEIHDLKKRIYDITKIPLEYQEELQMQRYKEPLNANSQKDFYIPHYDSQPMHIRPRTSTVILYLEEPEKGGETIFPFVRVNSTIRNKQLWSHEAIESMSKDMWNNGMCDKVAKGESDILAVKPRKGAAVLFYTLMPDGQLDTHSVHGSCPVIKGQKTVCQQWINTAWTAPIWSPDVEGVWRNPSVARGGNRDSSGKGRHLQRQTQDGDEICSALTPLGGGGILTKIPQARAFTFSTLLYLEVCSESVSVGLWARDSSSQERRGWELEIVNCRITLWGPDSKGDVLGGDVFTGDRKKDSALRPLAVSEAARGVWFHVLLITEDRNFQIDLSQAEPWQFKTFLVVSGQGGANSVEGELDTGSMDWADSHLCIKHRGSAKFSQTYFFSRQLSKFEVAKMKIQSHGDRDNNRVPPETQ